MSHEGSVTKAKAESSSSSEEEEEILGSEALKKKGKKSRNPKIYSCPTCCRSFTTKGNLEFHVNSIHLRITAYECNICSKVFAQAGNLKTHLENVHAKVRRFPCLFCSKAFSQKTALQNHHFNVHIQMHQQQSQQQPQQQRLAQQHSQQQTFHPPAQIEIVQNPLLMDPNAIQHLVQASNIGGIIGGGKPKRKNFIPLQTISETDLLRQGVQVIQAPQHVTVTALDGTPGGTPLDLGVYHQPLQSQSMASKGSKKKKHACTLCDKAFAQIINLRTHVATVHEGKKNYPCPECDKNFTQKGNLKAHITTIHQKMKNFQCVYCHKLFSQKGNMKTHIKNTHS
ncbi:uncharacterized protein [Lepeophtheirus salmonis]|uniref:uncharacterized protein n=1 Tax=Lepeophtheirus salmonis TaxID=72036 RepID=UPI001AEB38AE|nr:zinc finger protein 710-like [Lepeophtheirus salmonis]XP_040574998.1 zinc finger protein 710-like [Lepeophtheirus salmonis]